MSTCNVRHLFTWRQSFMRPSLPLLLPSQSWMANWRHHGGFSYTHSEGHFSPVFLNYVIGCKLKCPKAQVDSKGKEKPNTSGLDHLEQQLSGCNEGLSFPFIHRLPMIQFFLLLTLTISKSLFGGRASFGKACPYKYDNQRPWEKCEDCIYVQGL